MSEKKKENPTNDKIRHKEMVNAVKYRTVIKDGVKTSERIEV